MPKVVLNSDVARVTPNSDIAVAVAAGAAGVIVTRFVWKRFRNRKERK